MVHRNKNHTKPYNIIGSLQSKHEIFSPVHRNKYWIMWMVFVESSSSKIIHFQCIMRMCTHVIQCARPWVTGNCGMNRCIIMYFGYVDGFSVLDKLMNFTEISKLLSYELNQMLNMK